MKLYHGSKALFGEPSDTAFASGAASSEYGVGFNTSDYIGLAWEYAGGAHDGAGVLYEYDFDESRLSRWVVQGQPIGQAIHDQIMARLSSLPADRAQDIRQTLTPETDGFDTFVLLQGRTRDGCRFMMDCGIEGAQTNNYFVFLSSRFVPQQRINRVLGDFPAAQEALARQQETGRLTVEQPVKSDGTIMGPRRHYLSDELANAARAIHKTYNKELIALFETGIAAPLLSAEWAQPGGHGFSIRNNLGIGIHRLLGDSGFRLSDHWSGANTLGRTLDWMKDDVPQAQPLIDNVTRLMELVRARSTPKSSTP